MHISTKKIITKGVLAVSTASIVGFTAGGGVVSACSDTQTDAATMNNAASMSSASSQDMQQSIQQSMDAMRGSMQQSMQDMRSEMQSTMQTSMQQHMGTQPDAAYASYDADSLYIQMDAALREHAPITVDELRAEFLQSPDQAAIMDAVNMNSETVANLVEETYPGTHGQFLSGWNDHISYYQQYLHATMNGDEAGKADAKQKLVQYTYDASALLGSASSNIDQAELQQQLAVHGDQVLAIIDNLAAGNYSAAWQLNHEAYEHMGMLAELLAYSGTNYREN